MAATSPKNRMRPYSVVLLLAFTAAVTGVMMLNKIKEKRVHDILIQEKDREIMALNLRYQREKGYSKELQSKTEQMRAKIESLKNQKAKLRDKLAELQSVMTSLKEKRRTMGAALEKKQKKIAGLREAKSLAREMRAQLVALKEALKQKEDEIHELKHRYENPSAVQSVSDDAQKGKQIVPNDEQNSVDVVMKTQGDKTEPEKVEKDDLKPFGNEENENSERRQDETIVLVTNFDHQENPPSITEQKQTENQEAGTAGIKLENKDADGHPNALPEGNVIKDHQENLEDADIKQNKEKEDSTM